ncbi:phospholipase D-like domain-containing protein [Nocardioides sp. GXQ0305]|uniref:phospholipase D-like domain-containing protein n=1 Tax=Nocardioides sp. GXQ0305 TaxID=3423912 RepID=UPI003D7E2404
MLVRTLALTLAATALLVPSGTAPAAATPDHFTPKPGVTFNNPTNPGARRKIFRRVMRSINSVPRGENIDIFSWNFMTSAGKDALLRAQRRGVRVRLIMDDRNVKQVSNPPFRALRSGLKRYNRNHPRKRNSWARLCQGTCRSGGGSAHSKYFLFSDAGRTKRVVMQGSANFTEASTNNQWNDIYTHTRNRQVWKFYTNIFNEAAKDRKVRRPYRDKRVANFRLIAFPNKGKRTRDPVMQMLNRTNCRGATNTASHRTKIQIAPDVIRQKRGMNLARKLRTMWNNGCNIRIGYTVVGIDIGRFLRNPAGRGNGVPMKHLVQDFNCDREFDRYFHMKSMTIRGNYNGDRSGYALLNGSANWSGLGKISDENVGIYRSRQRVKRYESHLDYWYENFPHRRCRSDSNARSTGGEIDGDRLIFGTDENAVYEDGESVTDGEVDPFASMEE